MSESQTHDEVSRAAFALLLKEPFYAHVLAGMPRETTDQVKTSGTCWDGQQVRLRINPTFFMEAVAAKERPGVLKHEILHVVFRHIFRGASRHTAIYGIAADLVVNQLMKPFPLPDGYPSLDSFPDLGLEPDKTVEEYYLILMKLLREMQKAGFGESGGESGGESDGESDGAAWANATGTPRSAQALSQLLSGQPGRGDDSGWNDGNDGMTAAGRFSVGNLVLRARERLPPHQWGTLSASLISQLELILAERQPKLDWRRMVRIFCASSGRTKIRHTIKRISKRFGTRPGIKIQRLQRLLVAVDTSGSIDAELLKDFFAEIHGAWRAGASVTVVECDAEVQGHSEYRGKPPKGVRGGGGTEFEPVFRWMKKQRPFDGCLYLTDGYGPAPTSRPNCKLLWVLPDGDAPSEESEVKLPFGPTVRIPKNRSD